MLINANYQRISMDLQKIAGKVHGKRIDMGQVKWESKCCRLVISNPASHYIDPPRSLGRLRRNHHLLQDFKFLQTAQLSANGEKAQHVRGAGPGG